ncbi:hypothetical protein [Candidatus Thioglobus sp.]|uniref:hypothetical protein n=1 Tax=Candidatus Thioglobus sp. TaxID=2026721 RepID=UPI003D117036
MKFKLYLALSLLLPNMALAIDIYPQVSSAIIKIKAVGIAVNAGDIVIELDDRQAKLKLAHLNVIASIKQQAFDDAQLIFEQTKQLYDRLVASHRDLDIDQLDFNAKKRELNAHNIDIKIQEIELEKYTIRSPITGLITATPNLRNITNVNTAKILMIIE